MSRYALESVFLTGDRPIKERRSFATSAIDPVRMLTSVESVHDTEEDTVLLKERCHVN